MHADIWAVDIDLNDVELPPKIMNVFQQYQDSKANATTKYDDAVAQAAEEKDKELEKAIAKLTKEIKKLNKKQNDSLVRLAIVAKMKALLGGEELAAETDHELDPATGTKEQLYYGMIGSYTNNNGPIPVTLLSQPTSSMPALNSKYSSMLNGKVDRSIRMNTFNAYGYIIIKKNGKYNIKAGRATSIKIDSMGYDLSNYGSPNSADVELTKGIHRVDLSVINNGGQLNGAYVEIKSKVGVGEVRIVVFESDISALNTDIANKKIFELSNWSKRSNLVKGKKLIKP